MRHWIEQAIRNHRRLLELLEAVRRYRIPMAGTDPDALMQYDRQRLVKDALLERIATACVDVSSVGQTMLAALASRSNDHDREIEELADAFGDEASMMVRVIAAVLRGDNSQVTQLWPALLETLAGKSLLYVPLSKEGNTRQIVAARCRQCQMQDLLPGCHAAVCGWKRASSLRRRAAWNATIPSDPVPSPSSMNCSRSGTDRWSRTW